MHPDRGGDEDEFKELVKAFKSITDNETRKNWEEYGNPDGPGGRLKKLNFKLISIFEKIFKQQPTLALLYRNGWSMTRTQFSY